MSEIAPGNEKRDFRFVLLSLGFVAAWILVNSQFDTGWVTAAILSFLVAAVILLYVIWTENELLGKFLLFGLAAGFTELLADAWLVAGTKTLYYERGEPLLLDSPVYMPFAWAVVLFQIGYLGYTAANRWGNVRGSLLCGVIGGLIIPVYESSAKGAGWWLYEDPHHIIWNTPYYIILGEFLLALALPVLMGLSARRAFYWALPLGILMGLWIWLSYAVAIHIVG